MEAGAFGDAAGDGVGAVINRPGIWAAGRRPRGCLLPQGALSMRDAPPIFFLRHQKENAPRPVEKKKCLGGSVCAGADLLPPAGEGWQSRAAVRDGNARPLGNPSARGCPGYIQLLFSLPLAGG